MDNRLNSAYSSLKFSQQVLVTLLATDLPQAAKHKISDVLAELTHAQDALIVMRERLERLEFDHATLHSRPQPEPAFLAGLALSPGRGEGEKRAP